MRLLSPQAGGPSAGSGGSGTDAGTEDDTDGQVDTADTEAPVLPKRPALLTGLSSQKDYYREEENGFANLSEFFFLNPVSGTNTGTKNIMDNPPRQLQPLSLTLPSITSVANKGIYSATHGAGGMGHATSGGNGSNNYSNNTSNTSNKGNSSRKSGNGIPNLNGSDSGSNHGSSSNSSSNNKFYIRLLEDVHLDDQTVLFDLVDTLMRVRSENEQLKEGLWDKIDSLSTATRKKAGQDRTEDAARYDHNSLLFDSKLSNEQLKQMLDEQRTYNGVLAQTVDEFQDSLDTIMNSLVGSNQDAGRELISAIRKGEAVVEENSDEMWKSWMEVVSAMEDVAKFDNAIVRSIHGL